ncbi:Uu.00g078120.m01.CDS01 [Anthostomella pinea]|uniref:Uu.00g078120.m01.CDS01 n=1 Tax=Anthostomella pinea TaxID=933095 RepID=A0AAI8VLI0_9PEZI|nr:Uu.00g078120.m01.CDS01 [Anthostomella pinea]
MSTSTTGSAEDLGAKVIADICEFTRKRVQDDVLRVLKQLRHESLKGGDKYDPETTRFYCQQQKVFFQGLEHDLVQSLRHGLPKALNCLLDELEEESNASSQQTTRSEHTPPPTPLAVSAELPCPPVDYDSDSPFPRAPVAPMSTPGLGLDLPRRSATPQAPEDQTHNQRDRGFSPSVTVMGSPVMQSTAGPSQEKRPHDQEEAPKRPNKRSRASNQGSAAQLHWDGGKEVTMSQLPVDECVFTRKDRIGFYVLRCCKHDKCKKPGCDFFYFTNHPYHEKRAYGHFVNRMHNRKNLQHVFNRYAVRVIDATEERNIGDKSLQYKKDSHAETTPVVDASSYFASPPISPLTSRDKGKQPERPIDMNFNNPTSFGTSGARFTPYDKQPEIGGADGTSTPAAEDQARPIKQQEESGGLFVTPSVSDEPEASRPVPVNTLDDAIEIADSDDEEFPSICNLFKRIGQRSKGSDYVY